MHHSNMADWTSDSSPESLTGSLNILIVMRDRDRRNRIAEYLTRLRCRIVASEGLPPLARLTAERYNLLVLDSALEPLGGIEVLRRIRARSDIPVILVSGGPRDDTDCILALELGADDYVEEHSNPRELLARGRAILRRHGAAQSPSADQRGGYRFAGWELHRRTREVTAPDGQPVALSKNDYALLLAFLKAPGRPLSRLHLMQATRRHEDIYDRSIDVQVLRLRRKLEAMPDGSRLIRTDRSLGYIFDAAVEPLF